MQNRTVEKELDLLLELTRLGPGNRIDYASRFSVAEADHRSTGNHFRQRPGTACRVEMRPRA